MAIGTGDDFTVEELWLLGQALDKKIWALEHVGVSSAVRIQYTELRTKVHAKLAKAVSNKGDIVTIPFEPTCKAFLHALEDSGIQNELSYLDVRLGLEQVLDDPDYRAEATHRWHATVPGAIEVGPDSALEKFLVVSSRHSPLDVEAVRVGLEAIVDTDEFRAEAEARWERFDANPWPTHVIDDLGADDNAVEE